MTKHTAKELASRIHQPGCLWGWSAEGTEQIAELRARDPEAADMLVVQTMRAYEEGLPPRENTNKDGHRHASHRCPVGSQVQKLPDHGFSAQRPMPWTGELYAESADCRTLFRLYFLERRETWKSSTNEIVASGVGEKPVDEDTDWTSDDQTRDIHEAMKSGITRCENLKHVWRPWNTA